MILTKVVVEHCVKKVTYKVEVNGVLEDRVKDVWETAIKPVHQQVKLSDYAAVSPSANGREAKWLPEDLQTRLQNPTPVLVCEWPVLDPKQLALLKPDAIVLKPKSPGLATPTTALPAPAVGPVPVPVPQ